LSLQKIERLQAALGISRVKELKAACEAGKIRKVKGFAAKTDFGGSKRQESESTDRAFLGISVGRKNPRKDIRAVFCWAH